MDNEEQLGYVKFTNVVPDTGETKYDREGPIKRRRRRVLGTTEFRVRCQTRWVTGIRTSVD